MWIAGGIALFPAENLTVTADVQWTQWSKIQKIITEYKDASWALLMQASGKNEMAMSWNDAVQIRFGAEYRLSSGWSARAGYYFDPSPTPDRTMNILLPSYDFSGLTFGAGYSLGSLNFNFGLEYLMGKERTVDWVKVGTDPAWSEAVPGVYGMKILVPFVSLTYKFN
jgi:long-chain fatty acid transport protein